MARSHLNLRVALTASGLPAGRENGDSFTGRSPPQARQEEAGGEGGGREEWKPHCFIQNEYPTKEG
eukprot:9019034-Pyramimonas_sp.AAC.1